MIRRRRAMLLVQVLTVLSITASCGGLVFVGLVSIVRSQKQVAEFGNRYTMLNDFLRSVSRDVRGATSATLESDLEGERRQTLRLGAPPSQVTYRFVEGRVERHAFEDDLVADKRWEDMDATVSISASPSRSGDTMVTVRVVWSRDGDEGLEPDRRFDVTLRCAGELGVDGD